MKMVCLEELHTLTLDPIPKEMSATEFFWRRMESKKS